MFLIFIQQICVARFTDTLYINNCILIYYILNLLLFLRCAKRFKSIRYT